MSSLPMSPSPADRVGADAILDQSRLIESAAPVLKILNAAPVMAMVLNRQRQVVADLAGIVLGIEGQLAEAFVGVVVVALAKSLVHLFP